MFEGVGSTVEKAVVLQGVPRPRQSQPAGHGTGFSDIYFAFSKTMTVQLY